jgi:TonB family protein
MAVPIGDTLMTKPGKTGHGGDVKPTSAEGVHGFVPVAEMYISEHPVLISAPSGEDIYPPEAKRLGIEGVVRFKVGIDEKGKVVQVKVIEQAGHGFDEAATKAMWQAKFKPAISTDGRPVPYSLIYAYRFNQLQ